MCHLKIPIDEWIMLFSADQWKPINPEEKKKYDREFLLGFQFISASMHKPEGLPQISDVVLDKVTKTHTQTQTMNVCVRYLFIFL